MHDIIDEAKFWEWAKQKDAAHVEGMREKYGIAITQRIKEWNWQQSQLDKVQKKMVNLITDEMGKMLLSYMAAEHESMKRIIGELKEKHET